MNSSINELSELFKFSSNTPAASQETADHRIQEIKSIVTYQQTAKEEDLQQKRKAERTFLALGGIFAVSSILIALGYFFNYTFINVGGIGAMIGAVWAGIFTIKQLNYSPIHSLKTKINNTYTNLNGIQAKSTMGRQYIKIREQRKKIILGVGSYIAEKTDIAPEVVRMALVVLAFISAGTFIPAYIITGFIVNALRNKEDNSL